jgi:hypothetical protein
MGHDATVNREITEEKKKKRKQLCLSRLVQGNKETKKHKTQRTKQQIKDKLDNHTKERTKQG